MKFKEPTAEQQNLPWQYLEEINHIYFFSLILFHVMGLVLGKRNGTEKNTLLLSLLSLLLLLDENKEVCKSDTAE